ncbi:MAG: hypothetical protein COA57_04000 [Flavobacteriales bacterium]|nr:MAG: hypothetical protein COA57_04000 [Flavobacteriales bacterium]
MAGGRKPLSNDSRWSRAEGWGVLVPMPTLSCAKDVQRKIRGEKKTNIDLNKRMAKRYARIKVMIFFF